MLALSGPPGLRLTTAQVIAPPPGPKPGILNTGRVLRSLSDIRTHRRHRTNPPQLVPSTQHAEEALGRAQHEQQGGVGMLLDPQQPSTLQVEHAGSSSQHMQQHGRPEAPSHHAIQAHTSAQMGHAAEGLQGTGTPADPWRTLAAGLGISVPAARSLLSRQQRLVAATPLLQLRRLLTDASAALGISMEEAVTMASRQPGVLSVPPRSLAARAAELGRALGVPPAVLVPVLVRQPDLLEVPSDRLSDQCGMLADVLGLGLGVQLHTGQSSSSKGDLPSKGYAAVAEGGQEDAEDGLGGWALLEMGPAKRGPGQQGKGRARLPSHLASALVRPDLRLSLEADPNTGAAAASGDSSTSDVHTPTPVGGSHTLSQPVSGNARGKELRGLHDRPTRPVGTAAAEQEALQGQQAASGRPQARRATRTHAQPEAAWAVVNTAAQGAALQMLTRMPPTELFELLSAPRGALTQRLLQLESVLGLGEPGVASALAARAPCLLVTPLESISASWAALQQLLGCKRNGAQGGTPKGKVLGVVQRSPGLLIVGAAELRRSAAALRTTLGLDARGVARLALQQPGALKWDPLELASKVKEVGEELGMQPREVITLLRGAPGLLFVGADTMRAKTEALGAMLGLGEGEVRGLVLRQPAVLQHSIATLESKLAALAKLLSGVEEDQALQQEEGSTAGVQLAAAAVLAEPSLLTASSSSLGHKLAQLAELLGLDVQGARARAMARPRLLVAPTANLAQRVGEVAIGLGVRRRAAAALGATWPEALVGGRRADEALARLQQALDDAVGVPQPRRTLQHHQQHPMYAEAQVQAVVSPEPHVLAARSRALGAMLQDRRLLRVALLGPGRH